MFKKKLGFLAGVMVLLSLAGYLICLLAGGSKQLNKEESFLMVTSFYPMYVLAENVTAGLEGVEVWNLTENQTGCLHDYQLTSRDMKLLSRADAFLINGAGMELFMEKVLEHTPELSVIEASHGIGLLEGAVHDHNHSGEHPEDDHNHEAEQENGEHEDDHDEQLHAENGHVWMDVERYRKQLANITEELQNLLPESRDVLSSSAAAYDAQLRILSAEVKILRQQTEGVPVVIFHEAFAYLAESLGMEVLTALSLDEETVPSAGDIAGVIEEVKYHGTALIFIEEAYGAYADKIMAETAAEVVYLDPLTTGNGDADSYLNGMRKNLEKIRTAMEE